MKRENLHAVFVLLFLTIAFFLLEYQDGDKYARLFAFDADAVAGGEVWRILTFQFTQSSQGWLAFPKPIVLFFTLLLLYLMGDALEQEWGSRFLLSLFAVSTLVTAATAAYLGVPLLGSYFVNFTLLFVYASAFPHQTFFLFGVLPIRVRWIAALAALLLMVGMLASGGSNTAAFTGSAAAYLYYLWRRRSIQSGVAPPPEADESEPDTTAVRNAARFVGIKRAMAAGRSHDIDRLIAQCEREIVRGVNICPPADYKPENTDGYCIRCEGFAECTARYLTLNRPRPSAEVGQPSTSATA